MERLKKLPPIGARIIKSSVAVALCMVIYYLRTLSPMSDGLPFYSAISAIWCMQPNYETTKSNAGQRTIGTFIGALFGFLYIVFVRLIGMQESLPSYIFAALMVIPLIYSTVVMDKKQATFFSCSVFLSIALTHSFDEDPTIFVCNRILDTFIGIGVGVLVNNFHIPGKYDKNTIYVCGIDDVLINDDENAYQYNKVELNRLIDSGLKFTISTIHTPAVVASIMKGVKLKYPLIVMDGAAIYDLNKKDYLATEYLPDYACNTCERMIAQRGMNCFVNIMYDETILVFYGDLENTAEKDLYEKSRELPYRNYISNRFRRYDDYELVLYITVLDTEEKIRDLAKALYERFADTIRVTITDSEYEGYFYLRIYSPKATKQNMLKKLKEFTCIKNTITFGSIKGEYDVLIDDGGGNDTVKKIKKIYRNSAYLRHTDRTEKRTK